MTGLAAVISTGLRASASPMRALRTLNPAMARSASRRALLVSSCRLSSRRSATSGSMTLSWKLPDWAATVMAASLPITAAAAMQADSGITGLTFPGMIEDPGCSAGNSISPSPASGPEFIQRRSLAIFISAQAATLSCPDSSAAVSWLASASK